MRTSAFKKKSVTKRGHSIREICADLGVCKGFVLSEIKKGKLRARRLGRRVIALDEDLHRYLDQA